MSFDKKEQKEVFKKKLQSFWDEEEMLTLSAKYDEWKGQYGITNAMLKFYEFEGVARIYDEKLTFAILYDGQYNFERYEQAKLKWEFFLRWQQYISVSICAYGIKNYQPKRYETVIVKKSEPQEMDSPETSPKRESHHITSPADYFGQRPESKGEVREVRGEDDQEVPGHAREELVQTPEPFKGEGAQPEGNYTEEIDHRTTA